MDSDNPSENDQHLLRLNFGLAGVKMLTACIVDGYWMHTFHSELPFGAWSDVGNESRIPVGVPENLQSPRNASFNATLKPGYRGNSLEELR